MRADGEGRGQGRGSAETGALSDERLRELFREMLLIRRFEEKVEERFRAGELPGFLHVAIGQEAVASGVMAALEPDDVIASTHRAHGHTIAKGTHVNAVMAELYGKQEGCSGGYGGSMHLYDLAKGNLGANAVVGGGLAAITGAALAFQFRKQPRVAVAFFGDGATNTGTFHESLNLAQLWKVPALFVLEMNAWAESTPIAPARADRGLLAARRRVRHALGRRRRPGRRGRLRGDARGPRARRLRPGPVFLNVRTYRLVGHYIGDPQVYREKSEIEELRETKDPIELLRARLGSATRSSGRSTPRSRRSSRARSSSRRRAPTPSRKTPSSTSMPELTYREAVRDALSSAMRSDDDVFIMGEDIAEMGGSMGVTQGMLAEFGPERVRNTPISEMAIVGTGIGAAMQGMRPVVEIMYQDFLTLSMEQLVNQAAKHRTMSGGQLKVPLTIRTQGGAGWSPGAQHAQQLESWFVHVPGLKVVFPSTPEDVRGLLWSSIYDDNTVIFFEHRLLYPLKGQVPDEIEPIPLGKARVMREGSDVTVIAIGRMVPEALKAAEDAEKDGISVEVIDPRTLLPLDEETIIASVKKTTRAVTAHEAVTRGGFGAELTAVIQQGAFDYLDAPIERVGAKFAPLAFAPAMEQWVVPHAADVLEAVKRTVARTLAWRPRSSSRGWARAWSPARSSSG